MSRGFHSALRRTLPDLHPLKGHQSLPASSFAASRSSNRIDKKPTNGSDKKSLSSTTLTVMTDDALSEHRNSVEVSHTGELVCFRMGDVAAAVFSPPIMILANGFNSPDNDFD